MNVPRLVFFAACGLFVFLFGVAVGHYKFFPFRLMEAAKDSVELVFEEKEILLGIRPTKFLFPARHEGTGVVRHDAERSAPGLTLLAGFFGESNEIRLLRSDGTLVRRWPVAFTDYFDDLDHIQPASRRARTDWNIGLHGAVALADGSVVFNFDHHGAVRLSRCGEVLWTLPRMTHHSVSRADDGGLWFSSTQYVAEGSRFPPIEAPYTEDTILKVSREGGVEFEISVPQLMMENGLKGIFFANNLPELPAEQTDLVHLNDVEELTRDQAARFPQFAAGDVMVSLRNLNLVMVLDPGTRRVKWHQTGPWIRQHDPDFHPEGRITVFNNNSDNTMLGKLFGGSNIIEIDPASKEARAGYPDGEARFYTLYRGKHQVLSNGNFLVTESNSGRVFEADPAGRVVWQYINRYDETSVAYISDALRYPEDYFTVDSWECS